MQRLLSTDPHPKNIKECVNGCEVIIIGAGAAGLMCAIEAGKRNRKVMVIDHANKVGKKILMSGGGRCNFTNYFVHPEKYISHNPHFCKSALKRYTQWDFIELVRKYHIPFHEKTAGQLFCDNKSQDIVDMLLSECQQSKVAIHLNTSIAAIEQRNDNDFIVQSSKGDYRCQSLVIASGGLSIPTMGASPFGYKMAEQFGIKVWPLRAGLVPFTLQPDDKERLSPLSGISVDSIVQNERKSFRENILFTHRGLSGPAILQISSYWQPGEEIEINLLPEQDCFELLSSSKKTQPQKHIKNVLAKFLPHRLVEVLLEERWLEFDSAKLPSLPLQEISEKNLEKIAKYINQWKLKPNGTEGYRTAEVTLGGIDCEVLSSKTMEVNHVQGLYFIGEVVDVTGWLGGYNFQWAWSSGFAAGQVV